MATRKFKNKKTGRITLVDENNNIITYNNPDYPITDSDPRQYDFFKGRNPNIPSFVKPSDWQDAFYTDFGQYVKPNLTAGGGLFGSLLGPKGAALGAMGGYSAGEIAQNVAPRMFGKPDSTTNPNFLPGAFEFAVDAGVEGAKEGVMEGVGRGVQFAAQPEVRELMKMKLLQKYFPSKVDPAWLRTDNPVGKRFDLTIGQTNPKAGRIEDWLADDQKADFVTQQRKTFSDWLGGKNVDVEAKIKEAQALEAQNIENWGQDYSVLRSRFEPHITKNSKDVEVVQAVKNYGLGPAQPVSRKYTIEGAIAPRNSMAFAEKVGKQMEEILGPNMINLSELGPGTGSPMKFLLGEVNKLRNIRIPIDPKTGKHLPEAMVSYKELQAIKENIYNFLGDMDISPTHKKRIEGALQALAGTIHGDIEDGVRGWGKKAYADYRKSQDFYRNMVNKLDPKISNDLMKTGNPDFEGTYLGMARKALSDPLQTERFKEVTGNKKILKDIFESDMAKAALDPETGMYKAEGALAYLLITKPEVAKKLYSDVQLKNLTDHLRRANLIKDPNPFFAGKFDIGRMRGTAGATGLLGASLAGFGYGVPGATLGLISALELPVEAMRKVVQKSFFDPKYQAAVQRLINLKPAEKFAAEDLKTLLMGIRGSRILTKNIIGETEEKTPEQLLGLKVEREPSYR